MANIYSDTDKLEGAVACATDKLNCWRRESGLENINGFDSEVALQQGIDSLWGTVSGRHYEKLSTAEARYYLMETTCQKLLEALEDRYDGAPDSTTLWMGQHIDNLKAALGSAVS